MESDYIFVRGFPIPRIEVFLMQEKLGAQLFDESMFEQDYKRIACANVITLLDRALKVYFVKNNLTDLPENDILDIDIGDPNWGYIPVRLAPHNSIIKIIPTPDTPTGRCGWFRYRKYHSVSRKVGLPHVQHNNFN